jgi:hypothetical protein
MLYDILREKCDLDPEIQATIRQAKQNSSGQWSPASPAAATGGQDSLAAGGKRGDYTKAQGTGMDSVDGKI